MQRSGAAPRARQCFFKMKILHHSNETALEKCTGNGWIFVKKLRPRKFFSCSKNFFEAAGRLFSSGSQTQSTARPPLTAEAFSRIRKPGLSRCLAPDQMRKRNTGSARALITVPRLMSMVRHSPKKHTPDSLLPRLPEKRQRFPLKGHFPRP